MQHMLKKFVVIIAALTLLASLTGCSCSAAPAATPTPSMQPTAVPTPEIMEPSPDMSASPDTSANPDASANPEMNGETNAATIENFKEGTTVQQEDVPAVKQAIMDKYSSAKIKSIQHAKNDDQQVYAVEITVGSTTQTVYVRPDGTIVEKVG